MTNETTTYKGFTPPTLDEMESKRLINKWRLGKENE